MCVWGASVFFVGRVFCVSVWPVDSGEKACVSWELMAALATAVSMRRDEGCLDW